MTAFAPYRAPLKVPVFDLSARMANSVTNFLLHCILGFQTSTGPASHQGRGWGSSMVS